MHLLENLCQLCAEVLEESVTLESMADYPEIQRILDFDMSHCTTICATCFSLFITIQSFGERCQKAQKFFSYAANINDLEHEADILEAKRQFGLIADDVEQYYVKNELVDSQNQVEALDELNDLHQFSVISPACENNLTIENVEDSDEGKNVDADELESEKNPQNDGESVFEFSCHICQDQMKNFFSLQSHCRKEHDANAQILCQCGSTLTSRAQIHLHKKLHESNKSFTCPHCDKLYSHHQSLQSHIKKNHEAPDALFVCSQCPKRFDSEKKLKTHENVHLPVEKKLVHPCPYCDKKFTKSVNVQAHIKSIHQMERPFLCSDCGKNFSTKGALKEHQIIHSDSYPYQCSFCPKKFKNLPRLKTHEDIHNNTQYVCSVCGISLNTKRTLKMHMVVHSDQKKYKCQFCGTSFKRSKALKNHLILHSGLRPYACPFCDKTFANGSNCRSHKKKTHPDELAALEASGKLNSAPNIPRLEQLQPKVENAIGEVTFEASGTKQNLPSLHQSSSSFQVHQTCSDILNNR